MILVSICLSLRISAQIVFMVQSGSPPSFVFTLIGCVWPFTLPENNLVVHDRLFAPL